MTEAAITVVQPQSRALIMRRMRNRFAPLTVALLLLTACQGVAGDSSPSSLATITPTTSPTASAESSPTNSPQPTAAPLGPDDVVATVAENLRVRSGPGTSAESIGFLALGSLGFVMANPTEMEGVPWYPLSGMGLPYASGCATSPPDQPISCAAWQGWVAGASPDGDPWLERAAPPRCPQPPLTIEEISELAYTLRLVCWSGQELTFRAWWPLFPEDAGLGGWCPGQDLPSAWLLCEHTNYTHVSANEAEGWVPRLALSIDPASGLTMPERGQTVQVTGHFDDPAAELCADDARMSDADPISAVFHCRLQFVPSSVTAVSGG